MAQITLTENEYQKLKDDLKDAQNDRDEYRKWYEETKPEVLRKRLKQNAFRLANLYLGAIFKKLGFDVRDTISSHFDPLQVDRCSYLPDNWYLDEKSIKVTIDAYMTSEMREAFIRIGVITKQEKETDPLEIETSINN